ncbi:hypothetical protein CTI12_AA405290 [Artemisia annua]|uniref:DUF4216 domain-containing protein n=1 Tax=Artemisia annua TaxID=35608 RepID=A0A2U1M9K8_ARTAN|nr:hypothetical protein CTI12_AA405290 [Artemisia annua]
MTWLGYTSRQSRRPSRDKAEDQAEITAESNCEPQLRPQPILAASTARKTKNKLYKLNCRRWLFCNYRECLLFALACGPSYTAVLVDSCVVNGVKFNVHNRDLHRSTQNSGISTPNPSGGMYYGQLEEILEFEYIPFKVVLFKVKWFDTNNDGRIKRCTYRNNTTQIMTDRVSFENEPYILATQATQVFYLDFPGKRGRKVVRGSTKNTKLHAERTDTGKPVTIRFEKNAEGMYEHVGPHAKWFSNLVGELLRTSIPMHFNSWRNVPPTAKAHIDNQLHSRVKSKPSFTLTPKSILTKILGMSCLKYINY